MVTYLNGIHDISNEEYHSSEGISRSMLMEFKRSPYHYWYKYLSGLAVKEEATPAMNLGSAVHTLTLENDKFNNEFFICTQQTRPRRGTSPHEKMIEEANKRIILTNEEHIQAQLMANAVKNNKDAKLLLDGCLIEKSIFFNDINTGLRCKSRSDALSGGVVIDLKTTSDASLFNFKSSAMKYGYFIQAAMTYNALKSINHDMEQYVFIVVEKEPPYCVAIYILSDDAFEFGLQQVDSLLANLKKCTELNEWPNYGIQELGLPDYAKYDSMLEIE